MHFTFYEKDSIIDSVITNKCLQLGLAEQAKADYRRVRKGKPIAFHYHIFISETCHGCHKRINLTHRNLFWANLVSRGIRRIALMHNSRQCEILAAQRQAVEETWPASTTSPRVVSFN